MLVPKNLENLFEMGFASALNTHTHTHTHAHTHARTHTHTLTAGFFFTTACRGQPVRRQIGQLLPELQQVATSDCRKNEVFVV